MSDHHTLPLNASLVPTIPTSPSWANACGRSLCGITILDPVSTSWAMIQSSPNMFAYILFGQPTHAPVSMHLRNYCSSASSPEAPSTSRVVIDVGVTFTATNLTCSSAASLFSYCRALSTFRSLQRGSAMFLLPGRYRTLNSWLLP